jgi:DNA topoisomerase I
MNLIIVESPTKAKTIAKFLDKSYQVTSSYGHVRDLPEKSLGIEIDNNFAVSYVIADKAKTKVKELKEKAKKADKIILATDEDREGEAIAWHLAYILDLKDSDIIRITFHEITKEAIVESLNQPKKINQELVDAQQARRVLDRLVGYKLSPFLYKKVAKGLSAGRVQSVALRLIVEREREINNFKQKEYWTITSDLQKDKEICQTQLNKINNKSIGLYELSEETAKKSLNEIKKATIEIKDIVSKEISKSPPNPFTTSSLQQTANRFLGFSAKQTMTVAQKLYEQGYITYMRTDSISLAKSFTDSAYQWLEKNLGKNYQGQRNRKVINKSKNAQEAHEAIRPTKVNNNPELLQNKLEPRTFRLYQLIWQRAIASLMPSAKLKSSSIDFTANYKKNTYNLRASGQVISFDAYLKIYPEKTQEQTLPDWQIKDKVLINKISANQHFTKPPARYSDAGLVKIMEKHGIGRPSTYAPTISTIIDRGYVLRDDNKRLYPTDISLVVNDVLTQHFSNIVDYNFTAKLESDLDKIAHGELKWLPVIEEFYYPFADNLKKKDKELSKDDLMPKEMSEKKCPECASSLFIKLGRYGKFLACENYPKCKYTEKLGQAVTKEKDEEIEKLKKQHQGKKCDKCQADMIIKRGRFGLFLGCSAYPKCKNIINLDDDGQKIKCPLCNKGEIVKKMSKRGAFYACNNYPECKNIYRGKPIDEKCPHCQQLMIINQKGEKECSDKNCN